MIELLAAYRGGYQGRPGWWIRITPTPEAVDELKAAIPGKHRTFHAGNPPEDLPRWWVSEEYEPDLQAVAPSLQAYKAQGALF